MKCAYNPYSKFAVGAAVQCEDGSIVSGCNVENAVYGLTICAERVAICNAVSQGYRQFKAIAITSSSKEAVAPCGSCRQVIIEFGDLDIYLMTPDMANIKKFTAKELLPAAFVPDTLKAAVDDKN